MLVMNPANLPESEFADMKIELAKHQTLGHVLKWAGSNTKSEFLPQTVAEVVMQDEFTYDVIVPYKNLFLIFDTT